MAPKTPKAAKSKQKVLEDQREEALQAVVLADSFETRFAPFTLQRPRCLLPLANTPLIEYTLEFLANAGVQDIFLCCGLHTEQVEYYISSSKWRLSSPFRSLTLLKSSANSVGDVMRDLDKRGLMVGDFLLISGDVISNLSIESALAKHRTRREKDKNAIMTMVLREAGQEHRTKSTGRRPVFVIDPDADRCVHYEELGHQKNDRYVRLDPDMLKAHGQLEVREDLIDCYIDICTPEVLSLWSDNFDYQSVRQGFLSEVLKDYELTRKTIHTYVVVDQYAARVQSLRAYNAVTKDVISRWTYPLCPDSNLVKGQSYHLGKGKIYQENGVALARTCVVKSRSILGENTSLADGSVVGDSVLGRRCRIGKNVNIDRSYLWDDVVVGDGSSVRQAIIANDVMIGKNCKIEPGALISFGVRIADDTIVIGTSRVTRAERKEHIDSASTDNSIVGKGGDGYLYCEDSESDTTSTTSNQLYQLPRASISNSSISTLNSEDDEYENFPTSSRRSSVPSDPSEDTAKTRDFHVEAVASILDSLQKGDLPENILLELNSYRMSVDANPHEVRHAVVAAFMKRITSLVGGDVVSGTTAQSPQEAITELFGKYKALVGRNIFDKDEDSKADQVDFLLLVQKEAMGKAQGESIMLFVAKECYDLEIVEEDGVLQWWEDDRSQTDDLKSVRALTEPFIVFLREAEEEESDESSDKD
ncbi:hypothetical protein MMC22_011481 [Lobaria immixta]|nr:hypothetical protein [Lobaria immixta]